MKPTPLPTRLRRAALLPLIGILLAAVPAASLAQNRAGATTSVEPKLARALGSKDVVYAVPWKDDPNATVQQLVVGVREEPLAAVAVAVTGS